MINIGIMISNTTTKGKEKCGYIKSLKHIQNNSVG